MSSFMVSKVRQASRLPRRMARGLSIPPPHQIMGADIVNLSIFGKRNIKNLRLKDVALLWPPAGSFYASMLTWGSSLALPRRNNPP